MTTGKCRSCQAEVQWVKTASGKSMPVERDDNGNLIVVKGVSHVIPKGQEPVAGMPRFVSHFATCPYAGHHRRASSPGKAVASV